MKRLILGTASSALIAGALLAFTAMPALAKHGRVLGAAIAACNQTARDARKAAWNEWKAAVDKIKADRLTCLAAAHTGPDSKACNKTARDAMKAANATLRETYKTINATRLACIKTAQGK